MAEVPREKKVGLLKREIAYLKEGEYILSVRAQAAKKLKDKPRIERIGKALENTIAEIDMLEREMKKCQTESPEPK